MKSIETLQFPEILNEIAHYTQFSLSESIIRQLEPHFSPLWIQRENNRTHVAMDCERLYGTCVMPGISDIHDALIQASKDMTLGFEDLMAVAVFGRTVQSVKAYFKHVNFDLGEFNDLIHSLDSSIHLSGQIEACFTPSLEMMDSASSTLKSIRTKLRKTLQERQDKAALFITKNSSKLSEGITTFRNDRMVVLAKNSDKHAFGGFIHGESASGQSAYVEPPILIELNNQISELMVLEAEEIQRICFELSQAIKPHADRYAHSLDSCALIDGYFARAHYGSVHQGVIARVHEQRELVLKGARHPLIDPKVVVSNTYRIEENHSMVLITGPNTGGKTVSLKVIGLSCLMAYSGIPVCADEAILPLFDQIFVDIGDDQSIQQSLSTFSAHLSKLVDVINHATSKSLVLLDELGGGTDPVEGESLAMAILNHLRRNSILTVATTHYSRLKQYAVTYPDVLIASVQFDMEAMKPSFKYVEGLPGQSFALEIAKRFGLKASILEEARSLRESAKTDVEKHMAQLEEQLNEVHQRLEKVALQERELNARQVQLEEAQSQFETHKEALYLSAEEEVKGYIERQEEEVSKWIENLKTQESPQLKDAQSLLKQLESSKPEELIQSLDSVKVGQWVKLKSSSQVGQVTEVKKKRIVVLINGIKMDVSLDNLVEAQAPIVKRSFTVKAEAIVSVPHEINIIGLRIEEALPLVDQYLDDCLRAKYPFCRIIHGHGTGALRNAVHAHLAKSSHIESYRLGAQGEGGQGATVVSFKGPKST